MRRLSHRAATGDPVGILRIPKLGLENVVVEGADVDCLRQDPATSRDTAPLGAGNAVIGVAAQP